MEPIERFGRENPWAFVLVMWVTGLAAGRVLQNVVERRATPVRANPQRPTEAAPG